MYYQITFTLDKKIRGKFEMPHTIELDSKSFINYNSSLKFEYMATRP